MKTVKDLLRHAKDSHMELLSHCATPLAWRGLSPAELLMGRKIRITVPQPTNAFIPTWTHIQNLSKLHQSYKSKQDDYYNRQHRVKSLPTLPDNTLVWVKTKNSTVSGTVVKQAATPRSYIVLTPTGQVRRNTERERQTERQRERQQKRYTMNHPAEL